MEWIDNNQERLEEMVMQRTIERSKNETLQKAQPRDIERGS
jgi:hypothetical protein